jgi:hypothetical protein
MALLSQALGLPGRRFHRSQRESRVSSARGFKGDARRADESRFRPRRKKAGEWTRFLIADSSIAGRITPEIHAVKGQAQHRSAIRSKPPSQGPTGNLKKGIRPFCGRWSGQRGSNPRPQAWEACALPTELCPPSHPPGLPPGSRGGNRFFLFKKAIIGAMVVESSTFSNTNPIVEFLDKS